MFPERAARPVDTDDGVGGAFSSLGATMAPAPDKWTRGTVDSPRPAIEDSFGEVRTHPPVAALTGSLGPYRVLEPLGEGGMGVVYRARHAVTQRAVAVKTVRLAAPRWNESIRREIEALSRIRHPGIVRIVDHGVHEGRPWYAMDLLEGESLRDFGVRIWSPFRPFLAPLETIRALTATETLSQAIDSAGAASDAQAGAANLAFAQPSRPHLGDAPVAAGALPQVLALLRRVCATLGFLHGEGIVSCDLKPENILIVGTMPVLIDFGLSRRFPASSGREAMDSQLSFAGTLAYMSPEQLRGELMDARSDLYSVGCVLYEILTGVAPFTGAPFAVRNQHLTLMPTPLSQMVRDVPPALDALVMRLLQKDPNDRVGFADEVAAALAEIGRDDQRLHDFPPARPYLYRPRFVGRAETLSALVALRDAARKGGGAFALIGGESGAGKTRLALELSRLSAGSNVRVVASESVTVAPEQSGRAASSPLHAVRPLLRAMADRCHEGGVETTERLLGARRSVLAVYEPLLADVPATEPLVPPAPLAPDASRRRLLRYLAESLTAFAEERPLLWILDDLGWADDLSLAFLQSLTREYLARTPVLLIGLYRSDEGLDALRPVSDLPHVVHLRLDRLRANEVSAMVADMLAVNSDATGFASYVADAAEGNPFFVTEHVRAAVTERLFYRDRGHTWRVRSSGSEGPTNYHALPLPRSLRELVEHRLLALSHTAQEVARAAAVLGRESDTDVLAEVVGLSVEAATAAVDELIRRQVLEQPGPERLRFVHDKIREVAYAGSDADLRAIHRRAAAALEARWRDRADVWATIGHHCSAAQMFEPAVRYFARAADHARSTFANADAIVLYRRAIEQASVLSAQPSSVPELQEALGDVLALGGRHEEARAAYGAALERCDPGETVTTARLHRKVGNTWEGAGNHEKALGLYARARAVLPESIESTRERARDEWILSRFDELRANYWLARADEMDALVGALQPVIEAYGTPQQLAGFYQSQIFYRLGRERYSVSDQTLALSALVLGVCGVEGAPDRPWAHFQYGFTLLHSRRTVEASSYLTMALELAARAGDVVNQARAALYLAVAARIAGNVGGAVPLSMEAAKLSRAAEMRQYVAAAKAMDAWISVRNGDLTRALTLSGEALSDWASYGGVYPFHWLALVPRLEVQVSVGRTRDAVGSCRSLLAPDQRRLPASVEETLRSTILSWEAGDEAAARLCLDVALEALSEHGLR